MKYMEVTSPWPVHEFSLAARGGIYLCVLWNTLYTLYFVKPLEPKILKELKIWRHQAKKDHIFSAILNKLCYFDL